MPDDPRRPTTGATDGGAGGDGGVGGARARDGGWREARWRGGSWTTTRFPPPRHRPPWWPDGEPWPPRDAAGHPLWTRDHGPWRRGPRGAWARRIGCLFAVVALLALVGLVAVAWAVFESLGVVPHQAPRFFPFLGVLALIVAVAVAVRGFRRLADPLDDIAAAARRLESGDLSARVGDRPGAAPEVRQLARAFDTMATRLEADERRRRQLLADVSHELRTPLAVIRGNLEAMVDGIHPRDEAHLAVVVEEAVVMERLVEDLRTLALADAGALALHPEPTDLDLLIREAVGAFAAVADPAGVDLSVDAPDDLPAIDLDPLRMREVVGNLVSNALRHTPRGGSITVAARVSAPEAVTVTIRDTGEGIAPDLLPYVFDRFAKGPASRGSGLGLSIARDLVRMHGGTIEVASSPGTGTTFTIRLPTSTRQP